MISKTHISVQKLRGRQLNAKVCGSESAIYLTEFSLCSDLASYPGSRWAGVFTLILARN